MFTSEKFFKQRTSLTKNDRDDVLPLSVVGESDPEDVVEGGSDRWEEGYRKEDF